MTALERDLRYSTAPLHERCVYAQLFAVRHSIADALSLGRDPIVVVARALGVERDEATLELDRLRAAGLVGDGLTLLAGGRTRRRSSSETAPVANEHVEAVRAALVAFTGSRRALARDLDCSEGALRAFASGRRSIGAELLASLAAYLEVRTNECVPNAVSTQHVGAHHVSTQVGTHPVSPSDSLSSSSDSSVSSALSEEKDCEDNGATGGSLREPSQLSLRSDCAERNCATAQPESPSTPTPVAAQPSKPRRERRPRPAPAVDPLPPEGTVARRVYEAITTDVALGPRVTGPGDLSMRLAAICDGTNVDPAREVIALGAWLLRQPEGRWKDAAAGLLRNISNKVNASRGVPVPASGVPRADAPGPVKIDYQGKHVVGAAGLPSGDVWTNDRDEEAEAFARIRARTQPKGAMGR